MVHRLHGVRSLRISRSRTLSQPGWSPSANCGYAKAHRHPELREQTVWQAFEAERGSLVPYAGRFDGFHAIPASLSKTCLARFDKNKY